MNKTLKIAKWIGFIALAMMGIVYTSCEKNPNSPRIVFHRMYIDTTLIASTETPLYKGDTLFIEVELNSLGNELTNLQIDVDREYLKDSLVTVTQYGEELCTEYSQRDKGFYQFKPKTYVIGTYWMLTPIKARTNQNEPLTVKMRLKNTSKAEEPYNPYTKEFWVLVKDSTFTKQAEN
jgi:hypothetical protein